MALTIPAWLTAALNGDGLARVEVWAELWQTGAKVAEVEILDGAVDYKWGQDISSSVGFTVPGFDGLLPELGVIGVDRLYGDDTYGDGIYGDYIRTAYKGLTLPIKTQARLFWKATGYGTGETHTVPLGRFTITDVAYIDEPDGGRIEFAGQDCTWDLGQARFLAPLQIAAGTTAQDAVEELVDEYLPGTTVTLPTVAYTTPLLTYLPGGDVHSVWRAAADVGVAAGLELFATRDGEISGVEQADPATPTVVWTLADDGTAARVEQEPNADQFCNTVLAFGESAAQDPVYAVAQDETGPFGTLAVGRAVTREYRSPALTTTVQAQNAANALLRRWGRYSETVRVETFPVPHLEPGDYVRVADWALELDAVFRVRAVSAPLTPDRPWSVDVERTVD